MSEFSRRRFLQMSGGAALALTACGKITGGGTAPQLVSLYSSDRVMAAGRPQRIPFAVVDTPGVSSNDSAVATVSVKFAGDEIASEEVEGRIVAHEHPGGNDPNHQHADILRYFALRTTLPKPGIYDLNVSFGDKPATLAVQAFKPEEIELPLTGDPFPKVATPTMADPLDLDLLCTQQPEPCPFHQAEATEVLAANKPMALLVATPALCATAYCGPVLETLVAASADYPNIEFIHIEVYSNPGQVDGNFADPNIKIAKSVEDLGLGFEPSLFIVDSAGTLVDRIDNIYEATELNGALELIA